MDDSKVKGSVRNENIFKDNVKKEELLRVSWPGNWQWWTDLFRERERVVAEHKAKAALVHEETPDRRTTKPFPVTSTQVIGWLSGRREFQLEKYGEYFLRIPIDPPSSS